MLPRCATWLMKGGQAAPCIPQPHLPKLGEQALHPLPLQPSPGASGQVLPQPLSGR